MDEIAIMVILGPLLIAIATRSRTGGGPSTVVAPTDRPAGRVTLARRRSHQEMRSVMLYFEDLTPGRLFRAGSVTVAEADIVRFAREFDPQPFHTDPEAAHDSVFGGLAASGWHTAALTMRLFVTGGPTLAGGTVGVGVEALRWPRPVRPGDVLSLESEVIEGRVSQSRPHQGVVRLRNTTRNQQGEVVFEATVVLIVPRRRPL